VSLAGGVRDTTVLSSLAEVKDLAPPEQSLFGLSEDVCGFPVDHRAILWCFQLQARVAQTVQVLLDGGADDAATDLRMQQAKAALFGGDNETKGTTAESWAPWPVAEQSMSMLPLRAVTWHAGAAVAVWSLVVALLLASTMAAVLFGTITDGASLTLLEAISPRHHLFLNALGPVVSPLLPLLVPSRRVLVSCMGSVVALVLRGHGATAAARAVSSVAGATADGEADASAWWATAATTGVRIVEALGEPARVAGSVVASVGHFLALPILLYGGCLCVFWLMAKLLAMARGLLLPLSRRLHPMVTTRRQRRGGMASPWWSLAIAASICLGLHAALHVRTLSPFSLRTSLTSAEEISLLTLAVFLSLVGYWASFLLFPALDERLAVYQQTLFLAGVPVFALSLGALAQACQATGLDMLVIGAKPLAQGMPFNYGKGNGSLLFDAAMDLACIAAVLAHFAVARRALVPPPAAPLFGVDKAANRSGAGVGGVEGALVVTSRPQDSPGNWRRRLLCKSGDSFYEDQSTGDLLFPDGGPSAIFEQTQVDSLDLGGGVTLGPGFRVVEDSGPAFQEVWGTPFQPTVHGARQQEAWALLEQALGSSDAWFATAVVAAGCFCVGFGIPRTYHCLGGHAGISVLLIWRHLSHNLANW